MIEHVVVKGDTMWGLAEKYLKSGYRWPEIAKLNGIPTSKPVIYIGTVMKIDVDGTAEPVKTNNTSTPTVEYFGLQAGSDTTVFAAWKWDKDNTENYEVKWHYHTGDEIWFVGNDSTTEDKQSIYNAPSNAKKVKFTVKPIAKQHKVNGKETAYWTANWSTAKTYSFTDNPPTKPDAPTVEIKDYTLTASLDNLDVNGTQIEFQIVKDNASVFKTGKATIKTGYASYACTITPGSEFKVRCRAVRGSEYSEWTEYSDNYSSMPAAPSKITVCKTKSDTSIYLEWAAAKAAKTYEIEYTTKREYFDGSDQTTTKSGVETTHFEITGLEPGEE
jgi:LysM repeat protein